MGWDEKVRKKTSKCHRNVSIRIKYSKFNDFSKKLICQRIQVTLENVHIEKFKNNRSAQRTRSDHKKIQRFTGGDLKGLSTSLVEECHLGSENCKVSCLLELGLSYDNNVSIQFGFGSYDLHVLFNSMIQLTRLHLQSFISL